PLIKLNAGTASAMTRTMRAMTMRISVRVKAKRKRPQLTSSPRARLPPEYRGEGVKLPRNRRLLSIASVLERVFVVVAGGEVAVGAGGGEERADGRLERVARTHHSAAGDDERAGFVPHRDAAEPPAGD